MDLEEGARGAGGWVEGALVAARVRVVGPAHLEGLEEACCRRDWGLPSVRGAAPFAGCRFLQLESQVQVKRVCQSTAHCSATAAAHNRHTAHPVQSSPVQSGSLQSGPFSPCTSLPLHSPAVCSGPCMPTRRQAAHTFGMLRTHFRSIVAVCPNNCGICWRWYAVQEFYMLPPTNATNECLSQQPIPAPAPAIQATTSGTPTPNLPAPR